MTAALATTLPQDTGSGYVAAAYIVFFVILLIYVAIMALRLTRVERRLRDLQSPTAAESDAPAPGPAPQSASGGLEHGDAPEQTLEREPV